MTSEAPAAAAAAAAAPTVSPAKRSTPPPPTDLSKPYAGQRPAKRARDNKFDPTILPPSSDTAEILKQVEFYFSDANLPRDKFLWTQTQADPKREGWVSISMIAGFKRMRRFRPMESIVAALRQSPELLQVNEEGTHVKRKVPLLKPGKNSFEETLNKTLYIKGFGDETPTLQVDLEKYFGEFGEIESIRLRRRETGLFKGSVLVQFKTQADADKFLTEPREWNGSLLEAKTKADWVQTKIEENQKLPPEEREARQKQRERAAKNQKHFSAFKELDKQRQVEYSRKGKRDYKKGQQDRRGRGNKPRDRSRSPPGHVEDVDHSAGEKTAVETVTGEKRPRSPSAVEEGPSLFTAKREKLDDTTNEKRPAEEELNGEAKKVKADE